MILALLLSGLCWGQDTAYPIKAATVIRDCTAFELATTPDPAAKTRSEELLHGLVLDTARIGGGAVFDLWATSYALHKNPTLAEANPLGFNVEARIALKGALTIGGILGCHELRSHGHNNWAKWTARGIMAMQIGFGVHNIIEGNKGGAPFLGQRSR